ncbi:MAG: hypothetical protein C4523_19555 [Myxococcales bacterium]|nr:MAG: hypothetical protein C4523_19555 [Myxococcales bacterium]
MRALLLMLVVLSLVATGGMAEPAAAAEPVAADSAKPSGKAAKTKPPKKKPVEKKTKKTAPAPKAKKKPAAPPPPPNPYALPKGHKRAAAAKLYEAILGMVREKKWEQAAVALDALRQSRHGGEWAARGHLLSGIAYLRLGREEAAASFLGKAIGAFPLLEDDLRWEWAEGLFEREKYAEAKEQYTKLIAYYAAPMEKPGLAPGEGAPSEGTSVVPGESVQPKEAGVAPAESAPPKKTGIVPGEGAHHHDAEVRVIECLIALGKYKSALAEASTLRKAHEETFTGPHPREGDLLWLKGLAYRRLGDTKREAALLAAVPPLCPDCHFLSAAERRLRELRALGLVEPPESAGALLAQIAPKRVLWAFDEILELIDRWENQDPAPAGLDPETSAKLRYARGVALTGAQRYEEALAVFRALSADPTAPAERGDEYLNQTAKALGRMNRLEEASRAYLALADRFPDSSYAQNARFMGGWILGADPKLRDKADGLLREFIDAYPRAALTAKAMWFRGWYAYQDGDFDRTLAQFHELTNAFPRSAFPNACRYWIGRIHQKRGELEQAKRYYVFLAGERRFTYHRLLAASRLEEMETIENAHLLPEPMRRQAEAETAVDVADEEVEAYYGERLEEWENERRQREIDMPYSLDRFREGQAAYVRDVAGRVEKSWRPRAKRLDETAEAWRYLFPDLAKARQWEAVGLDEEAHRALARLTLRLMASKKKIPVLRSGSTTPEGERLLQARGAALDAVKPDVFVDLMGAFLRQGDHALAFRVYSKLMDRRLRRLIPWKLGERFLYPPAFHTPIVENADRFGVPDDLIVAVMHKESWFDPDAISTVNAIGLTQVMPATGDRIAAGMGDDAFNRSQLFDPAVNIRYGTWYLAELLKKFHGQWPLAIASYNGGPHNVAVWMKRNPDLEWDEFLECLEFAQTRDYVKLVLKNVAAYRWLYTGHYTAWDLLKPLDYTYENNINW